jgi:hypothetical protein
MSTLHNVTLPKSWPLLILKNINVQKGKDTKLYWIFVEHLLSLLDRMHTGLDAGPYTNFSVQIWRADGEVSALVFLKSTIIESIRTPP